MRVDGVTPAGLTLCLPYSTQIIGNPETGVIHGGAITTLMDTTCGISTVCVLPEFEVCPTIDLRIDYMRPAEPNKDVYGFAECYRVTPISFSPVVTPTKTIRSSPSPMWSAPLCAWVKARRPTRRLKFLLRE